MQSFSRRTIFSLLATGAFLTGAPAFAAGADYEVGLIATLSGQTSFIADEARKAIELRIEQINAAGGINGHQVKLLVEDDKGDPTAGVSIAQRYVSSDAMAGVLGPFGSATALAVRPVFERSKIVNLVISATADAVAKGAIWSFQIAAPDSVYATTLANYAADHGKAVGVINSTSAFGLGAYGTIETVLKDRNVAMAAHEQITDGQPDISPQVLNLKNAGADYVVAIVLGGDAAKLCVTARDLGFNATFLGQSAWSFPNTLTLAKGACDGALFTDPFDPAKPETKALLDQYEAKYGVRPNSYFSSAGWDAINLWAEAAKQAGSADTDKLDQEKMLSYLNNLKDYPSAIGAGDWKITFTPDQHVAVGAAGTHLRRIQGDQLVPAE